MRVGSYIYGESKVNDNDIYYKDLNSRFSAALLAQNNLEPELPQHPLTVKLCLLKYVNIRIYLLAVMLTLHSFSSRVVRPGNF
jgi:hypothetical protein